MISPQAVRLLQEIRDAVAGGGGGGEVTLASESLDALSTIISTANNDIETSLIGIASSLNDVYAELLQKLEEGEDVGLTPDAIDALSAAIGALYAIPTDYPDAATHSRLDDIKGYVDGIEGLLTASNVNTAGVRTDLGTDGAAPPVVAGTGVRGWLRAIYDKLSATIATTQSGTWTVQPGNTANTTAWKVDGSAVTQPVSGPLTDAQLRASAVPVTAAALADGTQLAKLTDGTQIANTFASDSGQNGLLAGNSFKTVSFSGQGNGSTTSTDFGAYGFISVHVTNVSGGIVAFECSLDGTNWRQLALTASTLVSGPPVVSSGNVGIYYGTLPGRYFRLTFSATSGSTGAGTIVAKSLGNPAIALGTAAVQSGTWTVQPGNTANTSPWLVQSSYSYNHISTATTTTVKSGAGVLHAIAINSLGTVASQATVYDSTTGSGTVIAVVDTLAQLRTVLLDIAFTTGLTIVTTGTVAPDLTAAYR